MGFTFLTNLELLQLLVFKTHFIMVHTPHEEPGMRITEFILICLPSCHHKCNNGRFATCTRDYYFFFENVLNLFLQPLLLFIMQFSEK